MNTPTDVRHQPLPTPASPGVSRPCITTPPPRDVPETYATMAAFLREVETGLKVVYSFINHKYRSDFLGLSQIKGNEVLIGITRTSEQPFAEKSLEKEGWTHLLNFSGNGGSGLKLWIKDREGDALAQVGPEIPALTCKIEDRCVISGNVNPGFPACCGAYVYHPQTNTPYKRTAGRRYTDSEPNQVAKHAPRCYMDGATPSDYLQLSAVEVGASDLVSNLMDIGFVPIYKYSKVDGTAMFLMAKQPPHTKGALLIQGKNKTSLTTFIKQIHGIKD